MSLFDSASLVVTPNGYKEDKLYSIKPTDGSGDLVVTRATTATRVNSDGLIEQVPYNLLQYSEQLGNAVWQSNLFGNWSVATVTSNTTTAPDGTMTADTISLTSPVSNSLQRVSVSPSNSYTYTIYIKAPNGQNYNNQLVLRVTTGNNNVLVNENFQVLNISSTISTTEWQRYTINFTVPSSGVNQVEVGVTSLNSLSINANVYAWGGQLVTGNSAKEYFPTTDRLNVPRLDYTNSSCPSILVEPQRTNLILRSQEFDNASWTKAGVNVTANNTISPTGLTDAELLTTSTSGAVGMYQLISTGSGTFSFSVFAKKGNNNYFAINIQANSTNNCTAVFDLSDGTLGEYQTEGSTSYINHKIESYGNGWYRCTIVFSTTSNPYFFPMFAPLKTGNSFTSSGEVNGNTSGKTLYLFGAQLEAGSYATSYIPTVASSVTRNADVISKTGISSLIGQTEGTIFVDIVYNGSESQSGNIFSFDQSTAGSVVIIRNSSGSIGAAVWDGSAKAVINGGSMPIGQRTKIAYAYKSGSTALFVNGVQIESTSGDTFTLPTVSQIYLNSITAYFAFQQNASFDQAILFKTRLTDEQLAQLTTI